MVQFKSDNGVDSLAAGVLPAPLCSYLERLPAIEIISVYHQERLLDHVLGHKDSMRRAPRLLPLGVEAEPGRNLAELLGDEHELERSPVTAFDIAVFLLDALLEGFEEILAYHIYDFPESGVHCVIDGIVDDCLSVRAEAVHLLEPAVSAAHAGRKDQKCWFHNKVSIGFKFGQI